MVRSCQNCGKQDKLADCQACKRTYYCSRECQITDWKFHKEHCQKIELQPGTPPKEDVLVFPPEEIPTYQKREIPVVPKPSPRKRSKPLSAFNIIKEALKQRLKEEDASLANLEQLLLGKLEEGHYDLKTKTAFLDLIYNRTKHLAKKISHQKTNDLSHLGELEDFFKSFSLLVGFKQRDLETPPSDRSRNVYSDEVEQAIHELAVESRPQVIPDFKFEPETAPPLSVELFKSRSRNDARILGHTIYPDQEQSEFPHYTTTKSGEVIGVSTEEINESQKAARQTLVDLAFKDYQESKKDMLKLFQKYIGGRDEEFITALSDVNPIDVIVFDPAFTISEKTDQLNAMLEKADREIFFLSGVSAPTKLQVQKLESSKRSRVKDLQNDIVILKDRMKKLATYDEKSMTPTLLQTLIYPDAFPIQQAIKQEKNLFLPSGFGTAQVIYLMMALMFGTSLFFFMNQTPISETTIQKFAGSYSKVRTQHRELQTSTSRALVGAARWQTLESLNQYEAAKALFNQKEKVTSNVYLFMKRMRKAERRGSALLEVDGTYMTERDYVNTYFQNFQDRNEALTFMSYFPAQDLYRTTLTGSALTPARQLDLLVQTKLLAPQAISLESATAVISSLPKEASENNAALSVDTTLAIESFQKLILQNLKPAHFDDPDFVANFISIVKRGMDLNTARKEGRNEGKQVAVPALLEKAKAVLSFYSSAVTLEKDLGGYEKAFAKIAEQFEEAIDVLNQNVRHPIEASIVNYIVHKESDFFNRQRNEQWFKDYLGYLIELVDSHHFHTLAQLPQSTTRVVVLDELTNIADELRAIAGNTFAENPTPLTLEQTNAYLLRVTNRVNEARESLGTPPPQELQNINQSITERMVQSRLWLSISTIWDASRNIRVGLYATEVVFSGFGIVHTPEGMHEVNGRPMAEIMFYARLIAAPLRAASRLLIMGEIAAGIMQLGIFTSTVFDMGEYNWLYSIMAIALGGTFSAWQLIRIPGLGALQNMLPDSTSNNEEGALELNRAVSTARLASFGQRVSQFFSDRERSRIALGFTSLALGVGFIFLAPNVIYDPTRVAALSTLNNWRGSRVTNLNGPLDEVSRAFSDTGLSGLGSAVMLQHQRDETLRADSELMNAFTQYTLSLRTQMRTITPGINMQDWNLLYPTTMSPWETIEQVMSEIRTDIAELSFTD